MTHNTILVSLSLSLFPRAARVFDFGQNSKLATGSELVVGYGMRQACDVMQVETRRALSPLRIKVCPYFRSTKNISRRGTQSSYTASRDRLLFSLRNNEKFEKHGLWLSPRVTGSCFFPRAWFLRRHSQVSRFSSSIFLFTCLSDVLLFVIHSF